MVRDFFRYSTLALLTVSISGLAVAQDQTSRERQAARRAQQQVQKVTKDLATAQEKLTAIEAEKTKLTEELDGAEARAGAASGRAQKLQQQLQAITVERDALLQQSAEQKTASDQRIAELNTRLTQLERDLSAAQEKGKQLEAVRVNQVKQIAACEDRNAKLYAVGRSVIDECRDRSAGDTLLRLEPFTGIARVDIENRLEAQRDLLDAQKTLPGSTSN